MRRVIVGVAMLCVLGAFRCRRSRHRRQAPELRAPDVFYVPTPQAVVDAMLKMANVSGKDVVYDLGCGDGRIPITAAQRFGAKRRRHRHRSGPHQRSQRERQDRQASPTR